MLVMYPLLVLALLSSVIAVFVGLSHGLNAMRAMRDHPNGPSLRLTALNLLEPSVTIIAGYAVVALFALIGNVNVDNAASLNPNTAFFIAPLIAGIPLSLMLLAPLFTPHTLPFRNAIATWGSLRWVNTVSLWIMLELAFSPAATVNSEGDEWVGLLLIALALVASGVTILWLSIIKLVPIVRELQAVEKA